MSTKVTGIYDARKELGWGKSIIMGLQQCFAMFGATILVPVLTNSYGEGIVGLSASVTLFCAGVATLWFHFITKGKVPVFLGSSFAFLGMYGAIIPQYGKEYATGGVVAAGGPDQGSGYQESYEAVPACCLRPADHPHRY